jgi:hypothetical protein
VGGGPAFDGKWAKLKNTKVQLNVDTMKHEGTVSYTNNAVKGLVKRYESMF